MLDKDTTNIEKAVDKFDPERCQGSTAKGQCVNKGAILSTSVNDDGTYQHRRAEFCRVHGANKIQETEKKNGLHNYLLHKWTTKFGEKANNSQIKNLRDEIAILRGILEMKLNQCEDETSLVLNSGIIGDLVTKIQKTVESCDRIDKSTGQLLDRTQVIQFSISIISVITEVLKGDEEKIKTIAARIESSLEEISNLTPKEPVAA